MFLAAFYLQVERDGRLHLISFYGANPEDFDIGDSPISIFENNPASEAVRTGEIAWSNKAIFRNKPGSLLAWPVVSDGRILGVLVGVYEVPFNDKKQELEYFEALASLVGSAIVKYLTNGRKDGSQNRGLAAPIRLNLENNSAGTLTERQELILKLIAEGRTNHDIADVLGYSESLIRQETIRIYALLGCSGRAEAAKIFKNREGEKLSKSAQTSKV